MAEPPTAVECLDVLDEHGKPTGEVRPRKEVHRLGLFHRAVHTWVYCPATQQLLLQQRAANKESWPDLWDVSSAGHIVAGDTSLQTAVKEMEEELGITLPEPSFDFIFEDKQKSVLNGGTYINNEFSDVYLVTVPEPWERSKFTLQESEVSDVKWLDWREYQRHLAEKDPHFVPFDVNGLYAQLFEALEKRENASAQ